MQNVGQNSWIQILALLSLALGLRASSSSSVHSSNVWMIIIMLYDGCEDTHTVPNTPYGISDTTPLVFSFIIESLAKVFMVMLSPALLICKMRTWRSSSIKRTSGAAVTWGMLNAWRTALPLAGPGEMLPSSPASSFFLCCDWSPHTRWPEWVCTACFILWIGI